MVYGTIILQKKPRGDCMKMLHGEMGQRIKIFTRRYKWIYPLVFLAGFLAGGADDALAVWVK